MRARSLAIAAILIVSLAGTAAAGTGLQPLDLRVDGGEESWHAEPGFALHWHNPAVGAGPGIAAVHYRLLEPSGQVALGDTRIGWAASSIEGLRVPFVPGAYTAEVWLEDAAGGQGPPVAAKLRFDDAVPGHVDPLPAAGWIGRTAFPYTLRLAHPTGPAPLSGIRGYAVSVDRDSDGRPCAGPDMCSDLETDLRGGAGEDSLAIVDLPEGIGYAHAVAVSGSGMRSALAGTVALRVDKTDPVTQLSGAPGDWSNRPVTLTARSSDAGSGMAATDEGTDPFTAIRVDGGAPVAVTGDAVAATVIGSGVHAIAYYARDAAGNVPDGGIANGQRNHAPATAVVRIDREAPRLAFVNAQDPRDPERIEARASDSLSGLDPVARISVRLAGSGDRFEALPTEVDGERLWARWDSEAYPPGEYEFRATAYDRAGNKASTLERAGGSAMLLRNPLKTSTRLLAGFGGQAPTVPHGSGALFHGRLIAGRRAGLAGMPVRVVERFDPGAPTTERVSTVLTGTGGAFSLHLAPGPSRQVVAVAPSTATLRASSSQPVRLAVRAAVWMRVSATMAAVGGRPVVFRGGVAGGGAIPTDGKLVQLQFRLPGLPWGEFRTVRTDRRGRFRYAYRFADDDSRGVRFQFRALATAQAGWPFEPASSRPVAVRGY